eukprot:TRINITY_DN6502_c0_g1_i1.p1 TRINITY_DN6502_c0_g1~~TRINITY_DN6502_c0_g1_i1.p1  ORF type:complete len:186 (-),score=26.27 TRINITY_DN6502_c0_g1_i1:101-658(-)
MPLPRVLVCFAVMLGFAHGQCDNDDYRIAHGDVTAFSVSTSDMICRCPAGIETNGTIRAASFVGSGGTLTHLSAQADVAALQSQITALSTRLAAANAKISALTTSCSSGSAITAIDSDGHTTCSYVGSGGGSGGGVSEGVFGGGLGSFCTSDADCDSGLGCYTAALRCLGLTNQTCTSSLQCYCR